MVAEQTALRWNECGLSRAAAIENDLLWLVRIKLAQLGNLASFYIVLGQLRRKLMVTLCALNHGREAAPCWCLELKGGRTSSRISSLITSNLRYCSIRPPSGHPEMG